MNGTRGQSHGYLNVVYSISLAARMLIAFFVDNPQENTAFLDTFSSVFNLDVSLLLFPFDEKRSCVGY